MGSILLTAMLVVIIGLKYWYTQTGSYDEQHLRGVTNFTLKDIPASFSRSVFKMFIYRCKVNYWLGIIVFILSITSLLRSKKYILLAWMLVSCFGYFIIMSITFANLDDNALLFHIESEWASLCIIIAAPFVFEYLPTLKPYYASWLLAGIFIIRLAYISSTIPAFSWRVQFEEDVLLQMKKKGINKLALIKEQNILSKVMLDWGLPNETILMSAMHGDKPQPTFLFVNKDDEKAIKDLAIPKTISISFDILPLKDLNTQYFTIDTTHPYQIMTYEELFR